MAPGQQNSQLLYDIEASGQPVYKAPQNWNGRASREKRHVYYASS